MIVDIRADTGAGFSAPGFGMGGGTADAPLELDSPLLDDDETGFVRQAMPIAAIVLAIAWIAGMLWFARALLVAPNPVDTAMLAAGCVSVPLLIGLVWLLALRTSRAEARRFGASARAMRREAATLEAAVARIAATLEDNRRALAGQIESLSALGDDAGRRLASVAHDIRREIGEADAHAAALTGAAGEARTSLDVLLASLPRARADTAELAQLLDSTGLSASEHAAALDAQLMALADRGREADGVAGGAAQRLAAHIARMEATSETASARLERVADDMSAQVDGLLGRTADAVDEARRGIADQGDAMLAMLGAHRAALDTAARESADALGERIGTVDGIIERVAERLERHRLDSDTLVASLDAGIARVEQRIDALHTQGTERSQLLAASISALGGSADAMTEALRTGEAMANRTIGTTESLLIALDAAAREIDETLPDALGRLDAKVADSRRAVGQAKPELLALVTAAESTHDAIEAIAGVISEQRRTLDHLSATLLQTLTDGRTKADALGAMVDDTIGRTHRFSEEAAPRLVDALLRVRDTAAVAADKARETLATVIPEAADALETATTDAMRRAASDTVERQVRAIADATALAVDAATRATERLSGQVQAIAEQTAIIESRIEDARIEREEHDRDTFARRVSLLIESLNSAAIDITKAFAPEVSDSAWAAYLKGDRGVFTRRAVRILEPGDAREIARLYDEDSAFREHVNRYIHDFEGMLRVILAQRDGSPLGVTLLSSDMGKLYVALAQAIERLR